MIAGLTAAPAPAGSVLHQVGALVRDTVAACPSVPTSQVADLEFAGRAAELAELVERRRQAVRVLTAHGRDLPPALVDRWLLALAVPRPAWEDPWEAWGAWLRDPSPGTVTALEVALLRAVPDPVRLAALSGRALRAGGALSGGRGTEGGDR